jgi:hypothetical protein
VREEDLAPDVAATNVAGRRMVGPSQGFGQLWRKRFWLFLDPPYPPTDVVHEWRRNFSEFWPGDSQLKGRIEEQEVTGADLEMPAGARIATGLVVVRSDADSFTLMTLQGHMFAGWVRFSAHDDGPKTRVEVEVLMRAGDPLYELGLLLGGHGTEEEFWKQTLRKVAGHFDQGPSVERAATLEDSSRQWSRARNIWYNAAIRTQLQRGWSLLKSIPGRIRR